ncbi:MAG: NUDIX hydrolase [Verrucomicrobia bacterium]|nr:MAG: NUDIX hydrolase [Verrucomicrobiota bacterium]
MIRNVIFDWSGTLVDDLPAVWRASNYAFKQAGVAELTLDQFRAEFCLPFKHFYQRYVPHVSLPQLEEWFHSHFKEVQHLARELPHAREFLRFCRERGLRTFLLSTIHRDHFAVQSAATGFDRFLDHPYIEVWDKRTKILELLQKHGLNPDETLFVGYNRLDQLLASRPDLIVEHLGELRAVLERNHLELVSPRIKGDAQRDEPPVVTVGALIFDAAGKALMVRTQKWSHLWGIPGGKIKAGESSCEALRREIKEETDLDIDEITFVLVQDCIHSKEFYRDAHFVLLNYTCRCVGQPRVRLNDEAQEFRWIAMDRALTMELNQPTRILIETVLRQKAG